MKLVYFVVCLINTNSILSRVSVFLVFLFMHVLIILLPISSNLLFWQKFYNLYYWTKVFPYIWYNSISTKLQRPTRMYDNLYFNKQSELTQEMVQLSRLLSWFPWFPSSSWWSPAHRCRWRVRDPQRSAVSYSEPVLWIGQTRNNTYNFAILASTFTISETRNNVSFV